MFRESLKLENSAAAFGVTIVCFSCLQLILISNFSQIHLQTVLQFWSIVAEISIGTYLCSTPWNRKEPEDLRGLPGSCNKSISEILSGARPRSALKTIKRTLKSIQKLTHSSSQFKDFQIGVNGPGPSENSCCKFLNQL